MDSPASAASSDAILPAQLRAARALLDWTRPEAAKHCGVGVNTIARFENGQAMPADRTMAQIVKVLETWGVDFINGVEGAGVVLRHPRK